ncbi:hypothetical protein G2W53_032935 [Senna tora]|uniref:DUF4216 domain-containing protein n=1 Tax=Senna tora TaxID=362788 RepID=A0A834SXJ9_9FABA|nr:hypothetical protein G2W53_032935 [Senna tora]
MLTKVCLSIQVFELYAERKATDEFISLAIGPDKIANLYPIFIVNRFRFHTRTRALGKKTQNSGVLVRGDDSDDSKEFYCVLEHVYELSYIGNRKVYIFKCAWWDVARLGRGYKIDKYRFVSVNTHCSLNTNEPFVLAYPKQNKCSMSLMSRVKGRGVKSGTRRGNERDEVTSRFQMPPIQHNNEGQTSVDLDIDDGPCLTDLAVDDNRAVGDMARLITNYLGRVLRTTVSFRDGTWYQIAVKHGPAMFTKMKDKFKPKSGMNEHTFEEYCVMALRKAFRTWKNTLHVDHYKKHDNDEDRLKHQPDNVSPEDWRWLVHHFGTPEFKRDPETGELASPDYVWEKQHVRNSHEPHMNRDEILKSVLGERSGHVRGRGYGANPIGKKMRISEAEVEARVASMVQSSCAKLSDELLSKMQDEIDRRLNAQLGSLMGRLQQGQFQATGSNSVDNSPTGAQNQ